jgi:ATP-dependent exoDNAse (exonuclease V) beta subunit
MLIVSRQVPQRGSAAWGVLNNFLVGANELTVPAAVSAVTPKPASFSVTAQADARAARSSTHDAVTPPSWSITSVTAEAKHIAKMARAAEPAAVDDATRVVAQDTPSHRADAGMAWGTLIHGLLEHAMRQASATREDLRRLALWLTVEQPQLRPVIEQAIDTVQHVATEPFWPIARSGVHSEEMPFVTRDRSNVTTGVIDLVFESSGGWQIIDYKTDRSLQNGRYSAQLDAYRAALSACGLDVGTAGLSHVRPPGA